MGFFCRTLKNGVFKRTPPPSKWPKINGVFTVLFPPFRAPGPPPFFCWGKPAPKPREDLGPANFLKLGSPKVESWEQFCRTWDACQVPGKKIPWISNIHTPGSLGRWVDPMNRNCQMTSFVVKISRFLSGGSSFLGKHGWRWSTQGKQSKRKLIESKVSAARGYVRKFPGG